MRELGHQGRKKLTKETEPADISIMVRCPSCGYFLCEQRSKGIEIRMICRNKRCKANVLIKGNQTTVLE